MLRARRSMSVEQLHAKAGFTRGYRVRTDMRQEQWCRWTSARRVLGRAVTLGMALAAMALLGMAPAAGWAQSPAKSAGSSPPQQSIQRKNPLLQAESWGYQLQRLDVAADAGTLVVRELGPIEEPPAQLRVLCFVAEDARDDGLDRLRAGRAS